MGVKRRLSLGKDSLIAAAAAGILAPSFKASGPGHSWDRWTLGLVHSGNSHVPRKVILRLDTGVATSMHKVSRILIFLWQTGQRLQGGYNMATVAQIRKGSSHSTRIASDEEIPEEVVLGRNYNWLLWAQGRGCALMRSLQHKSGLSLVQVAQPSTKQNKNHLSDHRQSMTLQGEGVPKSRAKFIHKISIVHTKR